MPDPELLGAIRNFPRPQCVTDVKSFIGLVTQVGCWNPDLSQSLVKMRELLKDKVSWDWSPEIEEEFIQARERLSGNRAVFPFDQKLRTRLVTDASRLHGCGYVLLFSYVLTYLRET